MPRERSAQRLYQVGGTLEAARQAFADTDGRRWHRRVILDDVEMRVAGRDLVGHHGGQAEEVRQGRELGLADRALPVLQAVQRLDQQIPPRRKTIEEGGELPRRRADRIPGPAGGAPTGRLCP